jgi:enoyl-CoA hydratase/carnithine racemase
MINVTKRDTVGIIELDRPQQRNALDVEHCHGLREAVDMVLRDRVRVVVITGAGSTFCSGADFGDLYDPGFRRSSEYRPGRSAWPSIPGRSNAWPGWPARARRARSCLPAPTCRRSRPKRAVWLSSAAGTT